MQPCERFARAWRQRLDEPSEFEIHDSGTRYPNGFEVRVQLSGSKNILAVVKSEVGCTVLQPVGD